MGPARAIHRRCAAEFTEHTIRHRIADGHNAVHEALNEIGLSVADFGEADAYAVSLLTRETDVPVDLADLASIALALRLDGQAVFIGEEKARLKGLAPANLVLF